MTLDELFAAYEDKDGFFAFGDFASRLMLSLREGNLEMVEARLRRRQSVLDKFAEYASRVLPETGWYLGNGDLTSLGPERYALLLRLRARLEAKPLLHAIG